MGMRRRGKKGTFWFELRVPKRFAHIEKRTHVRLSLGTDSEDIAQVKETRTARLLIAGWEAKLAGRMDDVEAHHKALVELCRASGFDYLQVADVAALPLDALVERTGAVAESLEFEAGALLGGVEALSLPVSGLLPEFERVVASELTGKDERQMRKWRNDRDMVVREFIEACSDIDLRKINRDHVSKYRKALSDRIVAGGLVENSANRRVQAMGRMVKDVLWDRYGQRTDVFKEMGFREKKTKRRRTQVSYSPEFIRTRILAPSAMDNLNEDARDLVLVAINTGAGPSELVNLDAETVHLGGDVPFIDIQPNGRELKNVYRERQIPLTGVSLEAMQRHPNGFLRYSNGDSVSNLINKYFRNNDLNESPEHTLKSLRHSFRDALRNAGCPDSIAEELMGHVQEGTAYGEGVWLETARDWLLQVAY